MKNKLRKLSAENIFDFLHRGMIITFALLVLMFVFLQTLHSTSNLPDNSIVYFYFFIGAIVLIYLFFWFPRVTSKVLRLILFEDINLSKYHNYFDYAYKRSNRRNKSANLQELYLTEAQVLFLRGDFRTSEQRILSIDQYKMSFRFRKNHKKMISFLRFMNSVHRSETKKITEYLAELERVDYQKEVANAIYDILTGQSNDYFETIRPKSHLTQIIVTYYRALNAILNNENEKAQALFVSIADENSELFYVQEAKKFLGMTRN
ncbi:hypothetical protein [Streptococcus loxodontisalivarius]|uniref:Uncharacterized protein n=1 Tax=Streptococcus loxodontisalivarius TaxID=1349415 RepID=A0ABS2PUM1_9STRE|nr:hypothetical protein [Streptococcus loxodontisalivarius]MBM7643749.1 hypothetical protein [Streptococcus loxodontisalivarius]